MRALIGLVGASVLLVGCASEGGNKPEDREAGSCVISGCSEELCGDAPQISNCIFVARNECFRTAICARQSDGACDWNMTRELAACLASKSD